MASHGEQNVALVLVDGVLLVDDVGELGSGLRLACKRTRSDHTQQPSIEVTSTREHGLIDEHASGSQSNHAAVGGNLRRKRNARLDQHGKTSQHRQHTLSPTATMTMSPGTCQRNEHASGPRTRTQYKRCSAAHRAYQLVGVDGEHLAAVAHNLSVAGFGLFQFLTNARQPTQQALSTSHRPEMLHRSIR